MTVVHSPAGGGSKERTASQDAAAQREDADRPALDAQSSADAARTARDRSERSLPRAKKDDGIEARSAQKMSSRSALRANAMSADDGHAIRYKLALGYILTRGAAPSKMVCCF